ncbi:hypothetical protein Fleli_1735 [Bernardetia litoralis DSM 6794]|uniref:Uncharacterized protein n=1 Tax=Bernardetia litoralis (strain ATCC 23117 / DSM 6794 / NBRC 15988 / NCIMB 1366 / Fx l1 / Sio-4) TaxID=880071 RepID=I4AJK0_BERLS|nr:hypothetical protein Fleli_1735 [Bernardetia litoralis DSM 6794]
MSKYAVINWNAEKLKSVKRDILPSLGSAE